MALNIASIQIHLKRNSYAEVMASRDDGAVRVFDAKEDDAPPVELDEIVHAVFLDVPPEFAETDIQRGEMIRLNRLAFDNFTKFHRTVVREATQEEMDTYDTRRDREKAWDKSLNKLRTACALC